MNSNENSEIRPDEDTTLARFPQEVRERLYEQARLAFEGWDEDRFWRAVEESVPLETLIAELEKELVTKKSA